MQLAVSMSSCMDDTIAQPCPSAAMSTLKPQLSRAGV